MSDSGTFPVSDPVVALQTKLATEGYVVDRPLAMTLYLAQRLESPVLLEGEPGVGKTSAAEMLAVVSGARLIRLQCYEGLAAHHALYEWDYTRLSQFQITIPELGTIVARRRPTIVLTDLFRRADLRRALSDLRRQEIALSGGTRIGHCLHHFLDEIEPQGALNPQTTALILSDGWDVGDATLLKEGMHRLRDQVDRIVWCDPHAAATDYRPQVHGLRVALPYVDDYLDFTNLRSLAELVSRLENPARYRNPAWLQVSQHRS